MKIKRMKLTQVIAMLLLCGLLCSLAGCMDSNEAPADTVGSGTEDSQNGGNGGNGGSGGGKGYTLPTEVTQYCVDDGGSGDPEFFTYAHTIVYGDHSVTVTIYEDEHGEVEETYYMEYDDHGNRTLLINSYTAIGEDAHGNTVVNDYIEYTTYEYTYDDRGRVTEMTEYREAEKIPVQTFQYEYDGESEKPVKITNLSSTWNFMYYYVPSYGEDGRQTGGVYYDYGGEPESYDVYEWYSPTQHRTETYYDVGEPEVTYDDSGRIKEKILYNTYGSVEEHHEYFYGENGLTTHFQYKADRELYYSYMEDEAGNVVEQWNYYGQGEPSSHFGYVYDGQGRLKEEIQYGRTDEVDCRYLYEYDAAGRMVKKTCVGPEGDRYYHEEYAWYDNGYLCREEDFNSRGMMDFREEYDEVGFHVLETEFYDGTPVDGLGLTGECTLSLTEAQYLCIRQLLEDIFF